MRRSGIGGHLSISLSIRRGMGRGRGRRRGTRLHRGMSKGVDCRWQSRQCPQSGCCFSWISWGNCCAIRCCNKEENFKAAKRWCSLSHCSRATIDWFIWSKARRSWVAASLEAIKSRIEEILSNGRVYFAKVWAERLKWGSERTVSKEMFHCAIAEIYWRRRRVDGSSPQSNASLISSNSCRMSFASRMQSSDNQPKT